MNNQPPDVNQAPHSDPAERYIRQLNKVIAEELEKLIPENRSKWFGSIEYRPHILTFETQNVGELVYLLVRKHWIKTLGWVINNTFYALIPIIILLVIEHFNISLTFLNFKVFILILLAYYSVIFTNVLKNFYDWYFDIDIITNERILEYEFKPFVSYDIKEAELESIQDVSESAKGIVADLFNYGDLRITTASHFGEFIFDSIPDPTKVRNILMDLVEIITEYKNANRP